MSAPTPRGWSTLFFRNRHLLWLSVVVIVVGGLSAALTLPRLEDPRIVNRSPLIITPVPGASAERVEALVSKVLEESLEEVRAIDTIKSTSRAGVSLLAVELGAEVSLGENERVFAEIRDKVEEAVALLPPEAGEPFVDDKRDPVAFTLLVGITWADAREPQLGLQNRLAEELADRLRNLAGTELVRIYGAPEEEITVALDRHELAEVGLTPREVAEGIGRADSKGSAGVLRGASSDLQIEVQGELDTVSRIEAVPLLVGEGEGVLRVGDLARVSRGWQTPEEAIALVDGRRSILVAARAAADVRSDAWARDADAVVDAFAAERGPGVAIERVFEQERYTSAQLSTLVQNLLAGALVILAVVGVVLGLRAGLVVALALPLVVSAVLLGIQWTGGAIHQISIFGMIIALGLLIDNAIVMTDEVALQRSRGAGPAEAVGRAVRHLFLPLASSTITTMLAFAPIMLLPGNAGDFVGSIGSSVILAIAASFAIAMTITAATAGMVLKPRPADGAPRWWRDGLSPGRLGGLYTKALHRLFRVPLVTLMLAAALPLAGFVAGLGLGNQFFPPVDRDMFEVRLWAPSGSSIGATLAEARAVEASLRELEEVESVSWLVGGSFPSVYYNLVMNQDRSPAYAQAIVTTRSPEATKRLIDRVQLLLDEEHPRVQGLTRQLAQGPPVFADVEYRLFGPDTGELLEQGDRVRVALQAHPDVLTTQASLARGEPKLFFAADEDAVRLAGLTLTGVAAQLQSSLEGNVRANVLEGLEQLAVRVRTTDELRGDLDELASLPLVRGDDGRWVSAMALGSFQLRPELGSVTRYNGERTNTIRAYVRHGALPIDVGSEVQARLAAEGFELPEGYRLEVGGASEEDAEAKGNLATYAPVLLTLMVATLILAFRSVRYAGVLLSVAFLSLGLALLSSWSIDFPLSFNTILGTLGLIGVALNDSIVVLAAIRAAPGAREGDFDALVGAVVESTRHVLATTLTTIGGFLPLLLFVGGDFWPSLAIVLVGGISGATLIALLFIPATYVLLHRRRFREHAESAALDVELAASAS